MTALAQRAGDRARAGDDTLHRDRVVQPRQHLIEDGLAALLAELLVASGFKLPAFASRSTSYSMRIATSASLACTLEVGNALFASKWQCHPAGNNGS